MSTTPSDDENVVDFKAVKEIKKRRKEVKDILDQVNEGMDSDEELDITLFTEDERMIDMNKKHAFINSYGGRSAIMSHVFDPILRKKRIEIRTPDSIVLQYSNQTVSLGGKNYELGKYWLKNPLRREYETIMFDPNLPLEHENCYNVWQGLAVEPVKGSWKKTRRHMYTVLSNSNPAKFKYLVKWFAWAVQNPGQPAEVAVVLKGGQGAGKGFIFSQFIKIFGEHGFTISNRKHLTGQFNGHFAQCCFLFADEAYNPGDKDAEGVLKQLITEKIIPIESKFRDTRLGKNCLHLAMSSNEKWVIPAASDSRRFYINAVDDKYAKNRCADYLREKYFKNLFNEMDSGGREAMLYDLMHMDLKGWHPRQDVPETEELHEQKKLNLSKINKAIYFFLEDGMFPGIKDNQGNYMVKDKALCEHIFDAYPEARKTARIMLRALLLELGVKPVHKNTGNFLQLPELSTMRGIYNEKIFRTDWSEPDTWRLTSAEVSF